MCMYSLLSLCVVDISIQRTLYLILYICFAQYVVLGNNMCFLASHP